MPQQAGKSAYRLMEHPAPEHSVLSSRCLWQFEWYKGLETRLLFLRWRNAALGTLCLVWSDRQESKILLLWADGIPVALPRDKQRKETQIRFTAERSFFQVMSVEKVDLHPWRTVPLWKRRNQDRAAGWDRRRQEATLHSPWSEVQHFRAEIAWRRFNVDSNSYIWNVLLMIAARVVAFGCTRRQCLGDTNSVTESDNSGTSEFPITSLFQAARAVQYCVPNKCMFCIEVVYQMTCLHRFVDF